MIKVSEDINKNSKIRKLFKHIDLNDETEIEYNDSRNEAILRKNKKMPIVVTILNKWSRTSSSEVRYYSSPAKITGNYGYEIIYRSKNTIENYTEEDYKEASEKLKKKIKSYLN